MSKTMTADEASDGVAEALDLFRGLDPATRQSCREYLEWLVHDGRPETDPMRGDLAWQDFKSRDGIETERAS